VREREFLERTNHQGVLADLDAVPLDIGDDAKQPPRLSTISTQHAVYFAAQRVGERSVWLRVPIGLTCSFLEGLG
jgi:hypothetical protein